MVVADIAHDPDALEVFYPGSISSRCCGSLLVGPPTPRLQPT